jgi:hypothetical protein
VLTALPRRIPRPSPALLVAIVALFMALGGTSYAALKITGKNVENSSLTGSDVKNKSLEEKELEPDTLTGSRIKESTLGTVPEAQHAANADNAINAQTAAKAADADKVGGLAPADLMLSRPRAYEANIAANDNFPNGSTLVNLPNVPAGTYILMARLSYYNPGATGAESCTLDVPGSNDITSFTVGGGETEAITLQEVVTSDSVFMPTVSCTSDGTDDVDGGGSIIAIRVD